MKFFLPLVFSCLAGTGITQTMLGVSYGARMFPFDWGHDKALDEAYQYPFAPENTLTFCFSPSSASSRTQIYFGPSISYFANRYYRNDHASYSGGHANGTWSKDVSTTQKARYTNVYAHLSVGFLHFLHPEKQKSFGFGFRTTASILLSEATTHKEQTTKTIQTETMLDGETSVNEYSNNSTEYFLDLHASRYRFYVEIPLVVRFQQNHFFDVGLAFGVSYRTREPLFPSMLSLPVTTSLTYYFH